MLKKIKVLWDILSRYYSTAATIFLTTFLLLFLFELGLTPLKSFNADLRVERYVKSNWGTLSKAYTDMSQKDVIALATEAREKMASYAYSPWVQFSSPVINGRFVKTNGLRRSNGTSSDWATRMPDKNHFDIYFFGGSTMFGFAAPDNDSIPANFEKISPKEWNVRTYNFGVPYYFSRQETMLFEYLIRRGEKPKVAVFLDGINDSLLAKAAYNREPFLTPLLRRRMDIPLDITSGILNTNIFRSLHTIGLAPSISSLTHTYFSPPENVPIELVADQIINNYLENIKFTKKLCLQYDIQCYFFWQPTSMFNYHNLDDKVSAQEASPLLKIIYNRMSSIKNTPPEFINLSNMLNNFKEQPFVDEFHYSGLFMKSIAKEIMKDVHPNLKTTDHE